MEIKGHINKETGKGLISMKIRAYAQLLKFRLSLLVAWSGVFGFAMAAGPVGTWMDWLMIGLGGLLITGASNTLNQVQEKELDAKMKRTQHRPLPEGRLTEAEGIVFALLLAIAGIAILGYFFNLPAALLGIIALLSYAFVYTPMKRLSPFAVFVGAIPGALPPLIGWVAFTGTITEGGLILFAFQFFWQFPHFWAIAWLSDEDYKRAGFQMLPTRSGRSRQSARLVLVYSLCLLPVIFFPWQMGMIGWEASLGLMILGLLFCYPAYTLWKMPEQLPSAKKLLYASFLYLPLMQAIFMIGN